MYIIVAGAGVVGFHITSLLTNEDHEVMVIEQSADALESISRQLDVGTVLGNSALPRILKEAGCKQADLLIAVTDSDETNMITCFVAKELGTRMTVARVRNREYVNYFVGGAASPTAPRKVVRPKTFGVDLFINPVVEAAQEIVNILSSYYSTPVENFADGMIQIREFRAEKKELFDKPIPKIEFPEPATIVAITRSEGMFTPIPGEAIREGDLIYVLAASESINEIGQLFAEMQHPARTVVILGGGRVGAMVAEALKERRITVKIIEKSTTRAHWLAAELEGVSVVQGDGTDRDFLIDQGITLADAFVASTDSDELNILSGLLAKNLGVARNLILVNNPSNIALAEAVGVNVAASPALLTARKIARFVLHSGVVSAAMLGGEQVQALEIVVSPESSVVGRVVNDIGLPKGAVMGALVSGNGNIIIPGDASVLQAHDHVIIVSPLTLIPVVEKRFK